VIERTRCLRSSPSLLSPSATHAPPALAPTHPTPSPMVSRLSALAAVISLRMREACEVLPRRRHSGLTGSQPNSSFNTPPFGWRILALSNLGVAGGVVKLIVRRALPPAAMVRCRWASRRCGPRWPVSATLPAGQGPPRRRVSALITERAPWLSPVTRSCNGRSLAGRKDPVAARPMIRTECMARPWPSRRFRERSPR